MTPSDFEGLLDLETLREGWDFEAKLAEGRSGRGQLPRSLWETYSAMANAEGGVVVLGARERQDGSFEVVGLPEIERVEADLWNILQNPQKVSVNLLQRSSVERVDVDGRWLLVLRIPRAERAQRPVFINGNPLTGTWIRIHGGDRVATAEQVKGMLADAQIGEPADGEILTGFGIDDLAPESVSAYRNRLRSHKPGHPFLGEDDPNLLRSIGALRKDRASEKEGLTAAGLLVFGKDHAIRDRFASFHVDYREVDPRVGARWVDRVSPDGTWPANLFEFFYRVLPRLTSGLKVPFQLAPDLFRREETEVHEALREAFANSIIHAVHGVGAGVRVLRYPDRFELVNPGGLLIPAEQALAGGVSECRNPHIQQILRLVGVGERAGSGLPAILQAWKRQHWRAPSLIEDPERGETRLELRMISLFPSDAVEELERSFGSRFAELATDARIALATAQVEGSVTNVRLQQLTDAHARDLTFLLRDLVAQGFLAPHGERRGRYYTVLAGTGSEADSEHSDPSSEHSDPSSEHSDPRLAPAAVSPEAAPDKRPERLPPIAARVAEARRVNPSELRAAVIELCAHGYRTLPELAKLLGRSGTTLRTHYLKDLLESGELELRFPGQPNHPHQAYRAKERGDR